MALSDELPIIGIDHLHLIVGNALQAAHFYRTAFGFSLKAYRGPESGTHDHASYVLEQGRIRLVLSTPLKTDHPMYKHIRSHGDGIRDVAFEVENATAAWKAAVELGAESAYEPSALEDSEGVMRMAGIHAVGDVIHSFVDRKGYEGAFRPGFVAAEAIDEVARPVGLQDIASLTAVVAQGESARWATFYEQVLGFTSIASVLGATVSMSKLFTGLSSHVNLTINEAGASGESADTASIRSYQGAGIQCVAFSTDNIADAIPLLQAQGLKFTANFRTQVEDRPTLRYEIVATTPRVE